ncbi:MAG: hypothetical protein GY730_09795 [bacterium]|nr:hypothetical protein [bacterium]
MYLEKANDNANLNIPPDTLSNIYLMLGKIFRKEEGKLQDAIVYFEKSAHVAPDSTYGKEAREMVVLLSD